MGYKMTHGEDGSNKIIPSLEGKRKRVRPLFGGWRTRFLFVPRSGGVGFFYPTSSSLVRPSASSMTLAGTLS